jgi:glutamate-1-semialdehyde 2,1-aminomutase
MAASLKSIEISHSQKVADSVLSKGEYFTNSISEKAKENKLLFSLTGPPSMPYPWFEGDDNMFLIQKFCEIVSTKGVYFHPHHNWFISNAHERVDLDHAIDVAGESMKELVDLGFS